MGSQGPLTPCPAPSGRRSPPRDQKEGAGAARPAARPSFSGLVGGRLQRGTAAAAAPQGRAPAPPGVARTRAGWSAAQRGRGWAEWACSRFGRTSSPSPSCAARPGCCCRLGVAASHLRVPLWPLLGSLAADMRPRGRFRAGCGRLGAPGVELARPAPSTACEPAISQPRSVRTSDDRRYRKKAEKSRERSKAALPAETQLKNAMDWCEESSNDSADIRYGPNGCRLGCLRGARIWPLLLLCVEY